MPYDRIGGFIRQLRDRLTDGGDPLDITAVHRQWACCWDCWRLATLRTGPCPDVSWSCPICGGASHVEVPRVTPSQPFYPIPPKPIDDQRIEPAVPYVLQWLSAHDPLWGNSLWRALAEWCKCLVTRSRRLGCLQFLLSPPIFAGCQPILLYSEGSRASPGIPYFASGLSRSVPVHANDWCKTCGRPQVAGPRVLKASPGCHSPRALCVCLLPAPNP